MIIKKKVNTHSFTFARRKRPIRERETETERELKERCRITERTMSVALLYKRANLQCAPRAIIAIQDVRLLNCLEPEDLRLNSFHCQRRGQIREK